jgi:hypothetical protein
MKTRTAFTVCCFVGVTLALPIGDCRADEAADNFAKALEYTRAIVEKHHLTSVVDIDFEKGKKSFRYDHYPEVERIQAQGTSYARKKGQAWLKSEDWAKTGKKVSKDKSEELDNLISFVDAPLQNRSVSKDKTQGGLLVEEIKREPTENGDRIFYEIRRENSTGFAYPQFVFHRYGKDPDEKAMLIGYAGMMYAGEQKIHVNISYSYMFLINTEIVNAKDIPKATKDIKDRTPDDGKVYNFNELDQQKFELKDKVVKLQITPKVLQQEDVGDGNFRLMVKDTASPKSNYGLVDFPKAGLDKLGLADKSAKENITLYIRVTPRTKEVVAQFTALGRSFDKAADGKITYKW